MRVLPARIRFPKIPKVGSMEFMGGVVPWFISGMFLGIATMDVLVLRDYQNALLCLALVFIFVIDAKKWRLWMQQRELLEQQLHTANGVLHASALATKAAVKVEEYDAVTRIADMNQMLAEAYLLTQPGLNVTVGADAGEDT